MSGPPGSQVVLKKNKRKNKNANSDPQNQVINTTTKESGCSDKKAAGGVTEKGVASLSQVTQSRFQTPRQENVYVDVRSPGDLYEQLTRCGLSSAGMSSGPANRTSKQPNAKRRTPIFQRDFNALPFPRGMINNSNFCFMNSILQSLLFIPAFAQLAVSVSCDVQAREACPTLAGFGKWALQYWKPGYTRLAMVAPPLMPRAKSAGAAGSSSTPNFSTQRRLDGSVQEDAQEFLQKLLERIQQELISFEDALGRDSDVVSTAHSDMTSTTAAASAAEEKSNATASQKGWTVVKGKEKLAVREHVDVQGQSRLLNAIFGGTLESHLQGKQRQRDHVSVLVERYFCLPVDIGFAPECTIEQALEHTFTTERIYDREREKNLKKTLRFGQLPSILLMQLRRWAVTREGDLVKLDNVVHLKRTLQIPRNICGDETLVNAERNYRLLSVVCHRGDAVGRGHYVAYIVQHAASPDVVRVQATEKSNESAAARTAPPNSSLILCNDTNITVTPATNMAKETVYFLVYQQMV